MEPVALIVPVVGMISTLIMVVFLRYYSNAERMAMIQKGLNPLESRNHRRITPDSTLKFGLLLLGAGLGLLIGSLLEEFWHFERDGVQASLIMIFGGGGLLLSYVIQMKNEKKEQE